MSRPLPVPSGPSGSSVASSPSVARRSILVRWLGVGLASALAVVTLGLALTGRLGLYVNPDTSWFAIAMAILLLVGAVASFALPLGAEAEHDHDHDHGHDHVTSADHDHDHDPDAADARPLARAAAVAGGVVASGVVLLALCLPPASLSAEIAMSRDVGAPPLFAGSDVVTLAATGDTSSFGIGEWATVFATATNPDAFVGEDVTLTGFATPGSSVGGGFGLTRLIITHCVIDAQPATIPVADAPTLPATGQWVTVKGTVRTAPDGRLLITASSIEPIDEPADPYEY